jgi:hypothetical protein
MSWDQDQDGNPVPATAEQVLLEFDLYGDQPLDNLVVYNFIIRGWTNGCPGYWENFSSYDLAEGKSWRRVVHDVTTLMDAGIDQVQIGVFVIDACPFWCGVFGTGACHSHGPLFDNFRLSRVDHNGPTWEVRPLDLFQDNFAEDGTKTGTVRMDIANNIASVWSTNILPGDSLSVTLNSSFGALDNHMPGDPSSGPAVYLHVKDVSAPKSGAAISGDLGRWPLISTGGGWTVLQFDTTFTTTGGYVLDRYCVDLNDILYTPGDTIDYYFSARNVGGATNYYSTLTGTTDSEADVIALPMEVTCLPANALSGATDILYIDDFDGMGAQPYFDSAFEQLGITVDRYDVLDPQRDIDNGPGSRVVDVVQQLVGCYRKIIWNSGNLTERLIGDGGDGNELSLSDDFAMLFEFLDQHPEGGGVYISGDNVAEEWVTLAGANAINLRSTYMNFDLVNGDHVTTGLPVSPLVIGQTGRCFDHLLGPDSLFAYGGCPTINRFDVLGATGLSLVEMAYENNPAQAAVLGQVTANSAGDTARVLLSGFSYHYIRDDRIQLPIDRVDHLLDVLRWLDNQLPDPTAIPDGPRFENVLAQNYPNPFNPTTTIGYAIETPGRVSLRVYNVAGQLVRTLVNADQQPRAEGFTAVWDGRDNAGAPAASGVYFYRLIAPGFSKTKKMVVIK